LEPVYADAACTRLLLSNTIFKGVRAMIEFFQMVESSGFSMSLKESSTAYVAILAFHTIGLSFLVGISGTTALRILGIAPSIPLKPMKDFFPLMWVGLWVNAITGVLLTLMYPTKYFVDLSFYIKLGFVVIAIILIRKIQVLVFGDGADSDTAAESKDARKLAGILLFSWLATIVTGRVMAYSIPTKAQTAIAVLIFLALALFIGRVIGRRLGLIETAV